MRLEGFEDVSEILRGGVYALCYRGAVVYIGQSKALIARVNGHRTNRGTRTPLWLKTAVKGITFDEVHIFPCGPDDRDRVEREMIDRYRPKFNIIHNHRGAHTAEVPLRIGLNDVIMLRPKPNVIIERRL